MSGSAVVTAPLVRIRDLTKSFGTHRVLESINLDIAEGQVATILGPSGSGKSTLLRCINHLERPDSGFVDVGGEIIGYRHVRGRLRELPRREVARQRRGIGFVFQGFQLFGHLTVVENIIEGPVAAGVAATEARARAADLLAQVGLSAKANAYPAQLSGGQQQRVAIARALAMRPRLLLFDEPTSALDPELVGEVLSVIADLAATGITMVIVTHEIGFARQVSNSVAFVVDGHVVESGPPQVVLTNPEHERARAFLSAVLD